jgi:hypothetical protein
MGQQFQLPGYIKTICSRYMAKTTSSTFRLYGKQSMCQDGANVMLAKLRDYCQKHETRVTVVANFFENPSFDRRKAYLVVKVEGPIRPEIAELVPDISDLVNDQPNRKAVRA